MYEYHCKLVKVVDADTYDVCIDLGFEVSIVKRVRLLGVNAPERFTIDGRTATKFVTEWFAKNTPTGDFPLLARSEKPDPKDKYGRYLAALTAGERSLAADLTAFLHG